MNELEDVVDPGAAAQPVVFLIVTVSGAAGSVASVDVHVSPSQAALGAFGSDGVSSCDGESQVGLV